MYSKYAPKECARCGKLHICTGTVHCPCFEVDVAEIILDYIAIHLAERRKIEFYLYFVNHL